MQQKSLAKNYMFNIIKTVMGMIFPLITFPYATRVLGVESLGKINYATSIVNYFLLFSMLGLQTYAIREGAGYREDRQKFSKFATEMFIINSMLTIVAYIAFAFSLVMVPQFEEYRVLLAISSTTIVFNTLGFNWVYNVFEEYEYITVRAILFQIVSLCALLMWVKNSDDYYIYAIITVFASAGSNVCNLIRIRRYLHLFPGGKYELKKHMRPIVTIFGMSIAGTIYQDSDITIIGFLKGDVAVGLYSAAVKIMYVITSMVSSLGTVILPRMSFYMKSGMRQEYDKLSEKSIDFILMLTIPISVGVFLLSREMLLLVCGKEFADAADALRLLTINIILSPLNGVVVNQLFITMGREITSLKVMMVSCIFNIVGNLIFIPWAGYEAAAVTTVLSEMIVLALFIGSSYKEVPIFHFFSNIRQYILAAVVMAVAVLGIKCMISGYGVFISIPVGACIYFSLLKLMKNPLTEEGLKMIKERVKI